MVISQNLDWVVFSSHRKKDLHWSKIFDKNSERLSELKMEFKGRNTRNDEEFEFHGLTGNGLEFKFQMLYIPYQRFLGHVELYEKRVPRHKWKSVRRWLIRVLKGFNAYLSSLEKFLPVAEVVKEFKDFLESSIGSSQRDNGER